MPVLERFYITVAILSREDSITRDDLLARSQSIAERMSRLYGLNAPEFFDNDLFTAFVDALESRKLIEASDDGTLKVSSGVAQIVQAAQPVISPEFQQAVLRPGALAVSPSA